MTKATVRDLSAINGKRVLVRVDHNVPQNDDGEITDDLRIRASLDTIRFCVDKGARVILCTHLGRPEKFGEKRFSVKPLVKRLSQYLKGVKITTVDDCVGDKVEAAVSKLENGEILYLENIRYYKEETQNDAEFAKKLARLCDYYVNDAFGAAHRAHASTEGIAHLVPAVSGFLLEREIKVLSEAVTTPKRPLTVILGGKKVSDKIGVIDNLLKVADNVLIGGGMAYTFAKAAGGNVGNSIVDEKSLDYCRDVVKTAKKRGINFITGVDCVAADRFSPDANTKICDSKNIPDGWEGLDIGPKTIELFKPVVAKSGTILWNGPLGVSEFEKFANGTKQVGEAVANCNAVTIIGGGDTGYAVVRFGLADKMTHISTGGGASLEFLEGKQLPGVVALREAGEIK